MWRTNMDAMSKLYWNSSAGRKSNLDTRDKLDITIKNLMLNNEVIIDFSKFHLDEQDNKKDFFNKLFSFADSSLEDPSYFLDFGADTNILEPNQKIWLDNYISPSPSLPYEIKSSYTNDIAIYTNTNILKSRSIAMQVINHYFYEADLSDEKALDTLNCLNEFFPNTLRRLTSDEHSDNRRISLDRLKQLNSIIIEDIVPYTRSFDNYQKWKDTLPKQTQLNEIDYYLRNDTSLHDDEVKILYADYKEVTGKELGVLSNGKSREINMIDIILSESHSHSNYYSDDTIRSIMQYPGTIDYIKNITDTEKLAGLCRELLKFQHINPEVYTQIYHQTGTKLLDYSNELLNANFDALLYFYQKDMLTDQQIEALKDYKDKIMQDENLQNIFYSKGVSPFNAYDLASLITKGIFTAKDIEKNPVLKFNSDEEKAFAITRLSLYPKTDEQKKIASYYLNQFIPYDPNLWIKNMANENFLFVEFFHNNMDKFKFDPKSENACITIMLNHYDNTDVNLCNQALLKLMDKFSMKDYLANNGDINNLGKFICSNKDQIKNFTQIIDEIAQIKPQNITSLPLAIELGRRGYRSLSPEPLISYTSKSKNIKVDDITNPEIYNFEKVFLLDFPYQHSSDSHTTFLNEMLWHGKKQETVIALNNGASPFTKAGFFRDKFTAMPFNMFFNRELKSNNAEELQSFMGYIASNLDEGKGTVLRDIWTSLGQKMRSDERVSKIIAATDKIYKSRDFNKERQEKELAKQEQERQTALQKAREEQEARERKETEARIRHERDISHLTSNILSHLGDISNIADKDIAIKIADFLKTNKDNPQVVPTHPNAEEIEKIMLAAVGRKEEQIRQHEEEKARERAEQEKHRQNILDEISDHISQQFDSTGRIINQDELQHFIDENFPNEEVSLKQDIEKSAAADLQKQHKQYDLHKKQLREIYYDVVAEEITNINGEIHRRAGDSKASRNRIYSTLYEYCEEDGIPTNMYGKIDITDSPSEGRGNEYDFVMKNVAYIEKKVIKDIENNNGIYDPDICYYSEEVALDNMDLDKTDNQVIKESPKQSDKPLKGQSKGPKLTNTSNSLADLANLLARNNTK